MTSGRPRRLLGPTVGSAVVLALSAFILWAVALWTSWAGECPRGGRLDEGLDKGVAVWPPAGQCPSGGSGTFWHQALPWAPWVIGFLVASAAAILFTGLVVAIRDLRRPAQARPLATVSLLEGPLIDGGPAGGHTPSRGDAEPDEPDRRAMAA